MGEPALAGVNTIFERDYHWPVQDVGPSRLTLSQVRDLANGLAYVKKFDVAVQAGGHVGVWPKKMALQFARVYTFEPDPFNFHCLELNAQEPNIVKYNVALGKNKAAIEMISPRHEQGNWAARCVGGSGFISMITIDSLKLDACDFMQLDVEGYEPLVVSGALETIRRFKPVLQLEIKGLEAKYGFEQTWPDNILVPLGYKQVERINRDSIFVA